MKFISCLSLLSSISCILGVIVNFSVIVLKQHMKCMGHFITLREGKFLIVPREEQLSIKMESLGFEVQVLLGS